MSNKYSAEPNKALEALFREVGAIEDVGPAAPPPWERPAPVAERIELLCREAEHRLAVDGRPDLALAQLLRDMRGVAMTIPNIDGRSSGAPAEEGEQ